MIYMFIIFTVWAIADLLGFRLIFDRFLILWRQKKKGYNYLWLILYFFITYIYCIVKYYPNPDHVINVIYNFVFFIFYLKAVPFIWSAYGINAKVPVIVFFCEEAVAVISSSLALISVFVFGADTGTSSIIDDSFAALTAMIFFLILLLFVYLRKNHLSHIGLADLPIPVYIVMIILIFCTGNLENAVWYKSGDTRADVYSVIVMIFVLIICAMVIFINKQNFSMENMISVLNNQMADMTGYYREMNDKENELRKIRHDTRNHLQAIHSLVSDGKNEDAAEYIEKIDGMYQKTSRSFDTGNFLADALLSSKSKEAEKSDISIDFSGIIPHEKIDDVDLVILLSNMLDNAIEASEKLPGNKAIRIESKYLKGMWVITMKNPVAAPVQIVMDHIATTKDDKKLHGIGLINMENVAAKYNGMIKFANENSEFIVRAGLELWGESLSHSF